MNRSQRRRIDGAALSWVSPRRRWLRTNKTDKQETNEETSTDMKIVPEPPTFDEMTQRGVIGGVISMAGRLNIRPQLCRHFSVVAHAKPVTDDDLREILRLADDYWEFDPVEATLTRDMSASGGLVRFEVDCSMLGLADVLSALEDHKPAF